MVFNATFNNISVISWQKKTPNRIGVCVQDIERIRVRGMVFNATFNNISVNIVAVSFIGGGNRSTRRKPPTCRKLLTNFIT